MMLGHAVKSKADDAQKRAQPVPQQLMPFTGAGGFGDLLLQRRASCACGGGCPSCSAASGLRVSHPNDAAEIEADGIADSVMRIPNGRISPTIEPERSKTGIQRKCDSCEDAEQPIMRKPLDRSGASAAAPDGSHISAALASGGRPLDRDTRRFFEPRLGYDLSGVRIHTGPEAGTSARAVNARAYTLGSDIVFGAGEYRVDDEGGKRLLAHELAHVVQAGDATVVHRAAADDDRSASASPPAAKPERLRFDVLGSDYAVNQPFAKAAALEPGIDIHVASLVDLVSQLQKHTGGGSDRCVGEVNFWNHGSPTQQIIAGFEEITRKDGKKYRLPKQSLSLDWLLNAGDLTTIENFRGLFCCGARMKWLGCGTAGVEASGGLRSKAEIAKDPQRFDTYGGRYQSTDDAIRHGASLEGAQFGFLNAQSWANATCSEVSANNDFTYMGPKVEGNHYKPGFGGQFRTFSPDTAHCSCDPATGRVSGDWNRSIGTRFIQQEKTRLLGGDYLWHIHLETFRKLQAAKTPNQSQLNQTVGMLIEDIASRVSIPPGLPVGPREIWVNSTAATTAWAGATLPHLMFCFPDNCWRWMAFDQHIIKTTPENTISVVEHELRHAADMWAAAQDFMNNGQAPPTPTSADCFPGKSIKNLTPAFGSYVKSFTDFYRSRLSPTGHIDIYAETVRGHIDQMTNKEVVAWFGGMLSELPPDIPAKQRLQAEDIIDRYFIKPRPDQGPLREALADSLQRAADSYLVKDDRQGTGKLKTLLGHFKKVWALRREEYELLRSLAQRL